MELWDQINEELLEGRFIQKKQQEQLAELTAQCEQLRAELAARTPQE